MMDCLICFKVYFDINEINVQTFSSTLCKLLNLTSSEIFNSTTTICPECTQKLHKVSQLFDQLDLIVVELGEFRRTISEDLIKSEKLSNESGNQVEERTKIVQEITGILESCPNFVSIPCVKLENTEEPNLPVFQDFIESPFFDNLEDLDDHSPSDIRIKTPPLTIKDARIILEPLPDINGQAYTTVDQEPIASFITRDRKRLRNSTSAQQNSISNNTINKRNCTKKSIFTVRKRSRRPDVKLNSPNEKNIKLNKILHQKTTTTTITKKPRKLERKRHLCSICGLEFRRNIRLVEHFRKHTGETPFTCTSTGCNKSFRTKRSLSFHHVTHGIGSDASKCHLCGKYVISYTLQKHIDSHQGLKNHLCDFCPKEFAQLTHLRHHRLSAHLGHKFDCKECDKSYTSYYMLRGHVLKDHKKEEIKIKIQCEDCGKIMDKDKLAQHRRSHLRVNKKPTPCSFCGKLLIEGKNLKEHIMKMHTGEIHFKCDFKGCKSTGFVSKDRLKRHMKLHSEKLDHICPYCAKGYAVKTSLATHLKHFCKSKPSNEANLDNDL